MADKAVIVTGSSSGLGAHITRRLVADGNKVVATARRVDRLTSLADDLAHAPGEIVTVAADITNASDVSRVVEHAVDAFGGVDVLVNNAGIEVQGAINALEEPDFELMIRTNVVGPYLCIKAALPHLIERRGLVVNIGSTVVVRAPRNRFGYVATKGAIEAMSRALAGDLGDQGVRVNLVRPGIVPSGLRGLSEEEESRTLGARVGRLQALPEVGHGRDVAGAVAYMMSDDAKWVTGAVLDVDGGYALSVIR